MECGARRPKGAPTLIKRALHPRQPQGRVQHEGAHGHAAGAGAAARAAAHACGSARAVRAHMGDAVRAGNPWASRAVLPCPAGLRSWGGRQVHRPALMGREGTRGAARACQGAHAHLCAPPKPRPGHPPPCSPAAGATQRRVGHVRDVQERHREGGRGARAREVGVGEEVGGHLQPQQQGGAVQEGVQLWCL